MKRFITVLLFVAIAVSNSVLSAVIGPVNVAAYVGKDARFTRDTSDSTAYTFASFGLYDGSGGVPAGGDLVNVPSGAAPVSLKNQSDRFYKGRLYFYGDLAAGRATFEIRNVSVADGKNYLVKVYTTQESKILFTLMVRVAPAFTSQLSSKYDIEENTDLNIVCSASGCPDPNITWIWKTDGSNVAHGTGSAKLSIPGITKDKKGVYVCQAINDPAETPITSQMTVDVQYPATIIVGASSKRVTPGRVGHTVTLICATEGVPIPTVTWYNDTHSHVVLNETKQRSEYTFTVKEGDFGNYTCKAKNKMGPEVSYIISLHRSVKPPPTTATTHTTGPPGSSNASTGVIAGAAVAGVLAFAGVIVAVIYWRRKKHHPSPERSAQPRREEHLEMQDACYATPDRRSAHDNRDSTDADLPQYAAVDKSKKTKKPPPGGLIYADLDFNDPDVRGSRPESQRQSASPQETEYAVVSGNPYKPEPQYGNIGFTGSPGAQQFSDTDEM